jgi:membrane protease YdiL (CAAX protease family)
MSQPALTSQSSLGRPAALDDNPPAPQASASLAARCGLVLFCLAAGLGYRAIVGFFPASLLQAGWLLALAALCLVLAVVARRSLSLQKYWEIPFAFFVFTIAGIAGDQGGYLQQLFVRNVLHEAPSAHNPLAATLTGTVLAQVVSTASLVIPVLLLSLASGASLKSIFLSRPRNRWTLLIGIIGFLVFYLYVASGRAQRFFPNNGVTLSRYLAFTPALIVLVLCNGLREELWFRGLFLNKYGKFLSPLASNILTAIIFTSFHVQITYAPSLLFFLGLALVSGLFLGYLMQKSGSLLPSALFHAGTDIPIFLVYLSYLAG